MKVDVCTEEASCPLSSRFDQDSGHLGVNGQRQPLSEDLGGSIVLTYATYAPLILQNHVKIEWTTAV